jgi:hypothetical protein
MKTILVAAALALTACGGTERDLAPALAGHWTLAVQDARTADVVLDGQGGGTMTFAGWTRDLSREDDPNTLTTQIDGTYWLDLRVVETETGISGSICTYQQVITKRQTTEIGNGCLSFTGTAVTPPPGT